MDKENFGWICLSVGVLCLAAFSRTVAQDEAPRVEWERTFGGEAIDRARSVQQTADGGYIVAGDTRSFGAGDYDVYLIKLDAQGHLDPRWGTQRPQNPKTFGGVGIEHANSVQQTADGGYILAGDTRSFGAGEADVYLIKLDAEGHLDLSWGTQWPQNPKTFGGVDHDRANSVQQTADGGYIVAGTTRSFGADHTDVYLMKLDAEGFLDPAWPVNPRQFRAVNFDVASSVQQTADGGYIVAGSTEFFGTADAFLIKLDAKGNLDPRWGTQWLHRTFGGEGGDRARSVQQTADGGYIVAGGTSSFGAGRGDVYLIKLNAEGHLDPSWGTQWPQNPKTYGGVDVDGARSVQQTADGGYIVAGKTSSFGDGAADFYLIKLDATGNLDPRWGTQWPQNPRTFGGEDKDFAYSVQQTADGGYIVAGQTKSFGGNWDVYLIKLAPVPTVASPAFRRGDANADGDLNITDAVFTLGALFLGEAAPTCADAADADDSGSINLTDAAFVLNHLFGAGPAPSDPFEACGVDPTDDPLDCAAFAACP